MNQLYKSALEKMNQTFEVLSKSVNAPIKVLMGDGYMYRHKEKTIYQAIIQKLARLLTGLPAVSLLNSRGHLQEQAALQRILGEIEEDIAYLCFAIIFNDFTVHHEKFLASFYEEEFDFTKNAVESRQKRETVPRQKIQAFIHKNRGTGYNQSSSIKISRTLTKVYSGYLHGASPQIMELYYGSPPKFQIQGGMDSPFFEDHKDDLLNYYYRSIISFGFSAKAFGNEELNNEIIQFLKEFTNASGHENHLSEPQEK